MDCKGFREYIATIVHTMLNFMEVQFATWSPKDCDTLFAAVLGLLTYMARQLKIDFAPFIPLVQNFLSK